MHCRLLQCKPSVHGTNRIGGDRKTGCGGQRGLLMDAQIDQDEAKITGYCCATRFSGRAHLPISGLAINSIGFFISRRCLLINIDRQCLCRRPFPAGGTCFCTGFVLCQSAGTGPRIGGNPQIRVEHAPASICPWRHKLRTEFLLQLEVQRVVWIVAFVGACSAPAQAFCVIRCLCSTSPAASYVRYVHTWQCSRCWRTCRFQP